MAFLLAAICLVLIALHIWERYQAIVREDAWRLERTGLLQRIQAPERAVMEAPAPSEHKPAVVVPVDDDAAFRAAREARNGGS